MPLYHVLMSALMSSVFCSRVRLSIYIFVCPETNDVVSGRLGHNFLSRPPIATEEQFENIVVQKGTSSRLLPQEAPIMIAEKHKFFFFFSAEKSQLGMRLGVQGPASA